MNQRRYHRAQIPQLVTDFTVAFKGGIVHKIAQFQLVTCLFYPPRKFCSQVSQFKLVRCLFYPPRKFRPQRSQFQLEVDMLSSPRRNRSHCMAQRHKLSFPTDIRFADVKTQVRLTSNIANWYLKNSQKAIILGVFYDT